MISAEDSFSIGILIPALSCNFFCSAASSAFCRFSSYHVDHVTNHVIKISPTLRRDLNSWLSPKSSNLLSWSFCKVYTLIYTQVKDERSHFSIWCYMVFSITLARVHACMCVHIHTHTLTHASMHASTHAYTHYCTPTHTLVNCINYMIWCYIKWQSINCC